MARPGEHESDEEPAVTAPAPAPTDEHRGPDEQEPLGPGSPPPGDPAAERSARPA
jgi:hypothetical protein